MIVIAGKNEIAIHGLKLALQYFDRTKIIAVVNASDKGVDGWQPSFLKFATVAGVKTKTIDDIYESRVDLFLSLEFDKIVLPQRIKTKNIYNIHFSLLPKYKGMFTSVWPILHGDEVSGVTLHKIDRGIDTGDIVEQKSFALCESDRSQDCYRKYIKYSKELLSENFSSLIDEQKFICTRQTSEKSSYYSKDTVDFSRLEIKFNKTAWQIKRQVYAFSFRPYQLVSFDGRDVSEVLITENKSVLKPGQIVEKLADRITIATVDYDIQIVFEALDEFLNRIPNISLKEFEKNIENILGVNDRNKNGWSPIIVAAYHGRIDLLEFLLNHGADVNDVNYKGTTVLMYAKDYALASRNTNIIEYLLSKGADIKLLDNSGKSVLDYISEFESIFLGLK